MRHAATLNSFHRRALVDLREAGFTATPRGNWICVEGGYRPEPIYSSAGVDAYIGRNEPPAYET